MKTESELLNDAWEDEPVQVVAPPAPVKPMPSCECCEPAPELLVRSPQALESCERLAATFARKAEYERGRREFNKEVENNL